jgi:hypothetical protein
MPAAIDAIRKFGRTGHIVTAADTFGASPGAHSRYAARSEVVASPRFRTREFVRDVARIVEEQQIDLVFPGFEDVFYLARDVAELPRGPRYFFPPLEILEDLHDKARLLEVARDIGVKAPRWTLATSEDELARATAELGDYFAKPVYSRGGVDVLTNRGPLAGARERSRCIPTPARPWVVEEYLDGVDICTFGIARRGKLVANVCYVHPREIEHAGGTVFESIDDAQALEAVQRFVEWARYDGQISFDFRRTREGLVVIECNPRPTAGVHLVSDEAFIDAMIGPAERLHVVPSGVRAKYSLALLRDMVLHRRDAVSDLHYLFSDAREAIANAGDPLPAAYQLLTYRVVRDYRRRRGDPAKHVTDIMEAYFDDVCWNGEPLSKAA